MSRARVVLFDLFDTLVDLHFGRLPAASVGGRSIPSTLVDQHRVLTTRGHGVDLEHFAHTLRASDRELYDSHLALGRELPTLFRFTRVVERLGLADLELPELLTRTHMAKLQEVAETPAHHAGVLERLRERHRIGLCSNFSHAETALEILGRSGLRSHFDALAISESVGVRKPRPEIFRHVLDELGVDASEGVHVGDRLDADVRGAAEVGLRTVWIRRRVRDPEAALAEYDGPRPTWIVDDLSEIPDLSATDPSW